MASWCWPNGLQTMPVVSPPPEGDFGPRKTGKGFHDGQDFKALFSPVRSIGAGQVVRVEPWNGKVSMQHGNRVYVYHGDGVESSYSHLGRIDVGKGQQVAAGTSVGPLGGTGFVTGPHLHFEVRVHGVLVDPVPFIRNMIASSAGGGGTEFDMLTEAQVRAIVQPRGNRIADVEDATAIYDKVNNGFTATLAAISPRGVRNADVDDATAIYDAVNNGFTAVIDAISKIPRGDVTAEPIDYDKLARAIAAEIVGHIPADGLTKDDVAAAVREANSGLTLKAQ